MRCDDAIDSMATSVAIAVREVDGDHGRESTWDGLTYTTIVLQVAEKFSIAMPFRAPSEHDIIVHCGHAGEAAEAFEHEGRGHQFIERAGLDIVWHVDVSMTAIANLIRHRNIPELGVSWWHVFIIA